MNTSRQEGTNANNKIRLNALAFDFTYIHLATKIPWVLKKYILIYWYTVVKLHDSPAAIYKLK